MIIGGINLTDILVPIVYVLVTVGLAFAFLFLRDLIFNRPPSKETVAAFAKRFEERLRKPDFEGLERHFGHSLPQGLKVLYKNQEEVLTGDFELIANHDNNETNIWYIAYYQPVDLLNVKDACPDTKQVFEFANDGCGNGYTIDPKLKDPPVIFYDHETGKWRKVANSFSEFMAMKRRQSKE
jgi:hypothetical protein